MEIARATRRLCQQKADQVKGGTVPLCALHKGGEQLCPPPPPVFAGALGTWLQDAGPPHLLPFGCL